MSKQSLADKHLPFNLYTNDERELQAARAFAPGAATDELALRVYRDAMYKDAWVGKGKSRKRKAS